MRTIKITLTFLIVAMTFVWVGCTKDTGTTPDPTDARASFTGRWSVSETWTKLSYEVNITADPNSTDGVFIANFANTGFSGVPAGASVSGKAINLDPDQVIGGGLKINGGGSLNGSKILWNYTLDDGATRINAVATYTRQ
ncbi:MAG: hypothetical protein WCI71_02675 [Bacteroidota bacterium]